MLLADEPVGSLDDENAEVVLDLLAGLNTRIGAAIVLVTHDPVSAARLPSPQDVRRSSQRRDRLMPILTHTMRLVARRPRRALASGLGAAMAAALLVSILLFGVASVFTGDPPSAR